MRDTPEDMADRYQRERVGVSGDPVPDHEYGDTQTRGEDVDPAQQWPQVSQSVRWAADDLAAPGILTLKQAIVYVLREVEQDPRQETADKLDVDVSTLDGLLYRARQNIKRARRTVQTVEMLDDE